MIKHDEISFDEIKTDSTTSALSLRPENDSTAGVAPVLHKHPSLDYDPLSIASTTGVSLSVFSPFRNP